MSTKILYARILQIWKDEFQGGEKALMPLVPLQPKQHCLLFVGLNPSFNLAAIRRWLPKQKRIKPSTYFLWRNRRDFDPQVDVDLQKKAKKEYAYFSRFPKLSSVVGVNWDHIDICFYRATSAREVQNRILEKRSKNKLTDFGRRQFTLSMQLIEEAEPRCIIVANALASGIYKSENGLEFSTSRGCYLQVIHGKELPVFLSSMITGRRALDNYSFERLAWHICRELDVEMKYNEIVHNHA
jgi:hypothetical protein